MTKQERYDLYQRAVEKWGEDSQFDQMIEEMAELTVALNKFKRAKHFVAQKKEGVLENIYEELADVKVLGSFSPLLSCKLLKKGC